MVRRSTADRGFTLVELIVAVALFSIVMLVSVSTLLALVNANRKAQAIQSVMNNLNIALDGMVRAAREGTTFHANGPACTTNYNLTTPNDCTTGDGGTTFSFLPRGNVAADPWVYIYDSDTKSLRRSVTGDPNPANAAGITAPEVTIESMRFYVMGSATTASGDLVQPKVVIVVKGSAGVAGTSARTSFHIQATAVQRILDI